MLIMFLSLLTIGELTPDPCYNVNIISLLNNEDGLIIDIVGLRGSEGTCNVSVSLTDCSDSQRLIEKNTPGNKETGAVMINVRDENTFNGRDIDITVAIENCPGLDCSPVHYYLPNTRPTG